MVSVAIAHGRWSQSKVYEVQAELEIMTVLEYLTQKKVVNYVVRWHGGHLTDRALTVVADGEVTLGSLVWQHVRVERGEELKLYIRCLRATGDHLDRDFMMKIILIIFTNIILSNIIITNIIITIIIITNI